MATLALRKKAVARGPWGLGWRWTRRWKASRVVHIMGVARRETSCIPLSFGVGRDIDHPGQCCVRMCILLQPSLDLSVPRRGCPVMCLSKDTCCSYGTKPTETKKNQSKGSGL